MVPTRETARAVGATVYVTLPLPVPLAGETVSHEKVVVAVHAQAPSLAVMAIEPLPPGLSIATLLGEME
jgi:hypothetical protein